jgi:flotillin
MSFIIPVVIVAAIVLFVIIFLASGYKKAAPDEALIISGPRSKRRILIGRAGIKIPIFERVDTLDLSLIPIDVQSADEVPTADYINVRVNSNVNVRIGQSPELLEKAATHFLNLDGKAVGKVAQEVLEGNIREIIGVMKLEDMVSNREEFCRLVKENASPDLAAMGLEIISFNVQNFRDQNGVIENLGVDNVVRIQKKAAISRAESERDIAQAQAAAQKEANDTKVAAAMEIARKNAELDRERATLKAEVDTEAAKAEAAKAIENENQRQLRDVAATNANIAKAEREAELKQKEIELKEYELDALVRKQADADRYAAEQRAEAERVKREADAKARAFEIKQQAEAEAYKLKQQADAQKIKAEADRFAAEQQAAGIAAVGLAEAEAIEKKAEAQKKMGEASVLEMYFHAMPQIVAAAAGPLENVDKITMYGDGNSAKMVSDVMQTTNQVMEAMSENGIDVKALLAGFMGGKAAQ